MAAPRLSNSKINPRLLPGECKPEVLTGRTENTRGSYRESVNPRPLPAGQLTTTLIRLDKTQHVKAKSKLQAKYDQTRNHCATWRGGLSHFFSETDVNVM